MYCELYPTEIILAGSRPSRIEKVQKETIIAIQIERRT